MRGIYSASMALALVVCGVVDARADNDVVKHLPTVAALNVALGATDLETAAIPANADEIQVVVDISEQELVLKKGGVERHRWPVSTGKKVRWTPTGEFKPQFLSKNHRSSRYNNAPMPYSVFFNGNIAIHGTTDLKRLGQRASHGCVRLHPDNAKTLFEMVEVADFQDVVILVQN